MSNLSRLGVNIVSFTSIHRGPWMKSMHTFGALKIFILFICCLPFWNRFLLSWVYNIAVEKLQTWPLHIAIWPWWQQESGQVYCIKQCTFNKLQSDATESIKEATQITSYPEIGLPVQWQCNSHDWSKLQIIKYIWVKNRDNDVTVRDKELLFNHGFRKPPPLQSWEYLAFQIV